MLLWRRADRNIPSIGRKERGRDIVVRGFTRPAIARSIFFRSNRVGHNGDRLLSYSGFANIRAFKSRDEVSHIYLVGLLEHKGI